MAIHSSTLNWANINSTTDRVLSPRIKDQIFKSNAFFTKCPKDSVDGGAWLAEPVFYAEGPGGSYSGTEALDASEVEQVTKTCRSRRLSASSRPAYWTARGPWSTCSTPAPRSSWGGSPRRTSCERRSP